MTANPAIVANDRTAAERTPGRAARTPTPARLLFKLNDCGSLGRNDWRPSARRVSPPALRPAVLFPVLSLCPSIRKNRMSRAPQSFKQRDMTRAIKAAQAAGLTAYRIEIVNGNPAIIVGGNVDNPKDADVKSWDEAIAELESRQ